MKMLNAMKLISVAGLSAAGLVVIPATNAWANTQCGDAQVPTGHSGVVKVDSSTYYGWCRAGGGFVRFRLIERCPSGGGGASAWASGSGDVTVYTEEEICWFGQSPYEAYLEDG